LTSPSSRLRPRPAAVGSPEEKVRFTSAILLGVPLMCARSTDPTIVRLACLSEMQPEATLIHLTGDVDLGTVCTLWSNLKAMREDDLHVVVDLQGIQHVDSSGIETLVEAHQLFIESGQRFLLAAPSPDFRRQLGKIAGSAKAIPLFTTVGAALASLRSAAVSLPTLNTV
jgi:anti-anti-sigma factor